ncbi:hypothetical protein Mnod_6682 [Methylobacterium nodulans ORS 2060]|uniref:Uncharacterized protein n=1 Tax=Methylobacterium nodulans (strain LMG 21967 / CNCM I-2342 / ORS 2060) TaxID=460265 RepID=B8IEV0_METNO|nr:hypothetical protein Mnod_6682 [Methylobacterium nodulans ORS 2060]
MCASFPAPTYGVRGIYVGFARAVWIPLDIPDWLCAP